MAPDSNASTASPASAAESGLTPLRLLSLSVGLSFSVGALAHLALDPLLGPQERRLAALALSFLTALLALHVRPALDTHVAWRVAYGFVLGAGVLFTAEILLVVLEDVPALTVMTRPPVAIPLGIGVGVLVEWHRHHRP